MGSYATGLIRRLTAAFQTPTSVAQNFLEPVGAVFNAEVTIYGELYKLPTKARLPSRARMAVTLLDRQPQLTAIKKRLDPLWENKAGGRLLVIISGTHLDLHQAFVLRCGAIEFREYSDDAGWSYFGRLTWPEGAVGIFQILRTVRDGLGWPKGLNQVAVEKRLATIEQSFTFSHYVALDAWSDEARSDQQERLVHDWIEYFEDQWPSPPAGKFVIGFLCIETAPEAARANALAAELLQKYPAEGVVPVMKTAPLDLVRPVHVDDWVGEASRYFRNFRNFDFEDFEAALLDAAVEVLPERNPRPFGEVFGAICDVLAASLPTESASTSRVGGR